MAETAASLAWVRPLRLAPLAGVCTIVWLLLLALQRSLQLPAGWGIEQWLGWSDAASVVAAVQGWCLRPQGLMPAVAYLAIDQVLFVPLYAVLVLALGERLRQALAGGASRRARWMGRLLGPGLIGVVAATVLVDTLENSAGLFNLGVQPWRPLLAAIGSVAFAVPLLARLMPERRWPADRLRYGYGIGGFVLGLFLWDMPKASLACDQATDPWLGLSSMHAAKQALAALMLVLPLLGAVMWWLGAEFDPATQAEQRDRRAALRRLAGGVMGRSRYVLAIIAVYGVLILALDQCRDVLLALADVSGRGAGYWLVRLPVWAAVPLAAALFSHSCWLWARLAGMVERPGVSVGTDAALAGSVGDFARYWARALSVVPLLLFNVLVALTVGDLSLASERRDGAWRQGPALETLVSAALLLGFAAGAVVVALLLLRARRKRAHDDAASYYNSEGDVFALLGYRSPQLCAQGLPGRLAAAIATVSRPTVLPLVALAGMVALRWLQSAWPEAMAPSPPTLAALMLGLAWWLGVLGWLSLWEQKHSLPWLLLPVIVIAALSAAGLNDNHLLALPAPFDEALLRERGRLALLVLMLGGACAWLVAVVHPDHAPRWLGRWGRAATAGVLVAAMLAALVLIDRSSTPGQTAAGGPPAPASGLPEAAPGLVQSLDAWLDALPPSNDPVYLVAAEGGGIRSAYWTAQVLAALGHAGALPGFAQRTMLLSGVSGGSMGIAIHRACWRQVRGQPADVAGCIDRAFDRLDALTPLLGALFFEDAWARVLPLARGGIGCTQPGCTHLDRAAWFERAWIRALPELAAPLQQPRPGEPLLAFNSTGVETGNRMVAASWPLAASAFGGAWSLRHCLGADTRLVTAAHTSARFPFTNPLAGLPGGERLDGSCRAGAHLIDGGYFDNSALPTVIDALQAAWPRLVREGRKVEVVLIRNGRRSGQCASGPSGAPRPNCVLIDDGRRTDPQALDQAESRERMQLYADALGPALALLNVSGVGSHGRASGATLRTMLAEAGRGCAASRVRLIDQVDDGSLVPLGWYLSPAARQALRRQLDSRVGGGC